MPRLLSFIVLALALAASAAAQAPPQEVLFPGQTGAELRASIRAAYRPTSTNGDNDDLYSIIDRTNVGGQDGVIGVYTGFFVPFDCNPNCDPSQDVFNNGTGINQEHTWPQAYLNGSASSPAESDLHNLYPTRVNVNSDRGNLRFAEIDDAQTNRWYRDDVTVTTPPPLAERDDYSELRTNTSFEPREVHEGNVARSMFYVATVWDSEVDDAAAQAWFAPQMQTLLDWHYLDPADQAEYDRTFRIAPFQNDKPNPFVLDSTLIRRAYPDLVVTAAEDVQPAAAALTVGPNPFRDAATVRLILPVPADAEVAVFDALGRRVRLLHAGALRSGVTAFVLQGTDLPPGLYLVRVVAGDLRLTRRLVRTR